MRYILICIALVAGAVNALAQQELIPRKVFFAPKDITRVKLDPGGQYVYYQDRRQGDSTLLRQPMIPGARPQTIKLPGHPVDYRVTYLGQVLLLIHTEYGWQLYLLDPEKPPAVPIGQSDWLSMAFLALSPERPEEVAMRVQYNSSGDEYIIRYNFLEQTIDTLMQPGDFSDFFFDAQLVIRAGRTRDNFGGVTLWRWAEERWINIQSYPYDVTQFLGGFQNGISVSSDGRLFYYTDNAHTDKSVLRACNVETGRTYLIAKDSLVDLLPFGAVLNGHQEPVMVHGIFAKPRRKYLDDGVADDYRWLDVQLDGGTSVATTSSDNLFWLVRRLTGGVTTWYWYARKEKILMPLFSEHPLARYTLAKRKTFTVTTRDDLLLPVQVYLPPGADQDGDGLPEKPLPTVIFVHGGPWVGLHHWNDWYHLRNFQLLANRGYSVINIEFRGTSGMGKRMIDAGDRAWGTDMLFDKIDIAQWAVSQGIAEADRMAIWGWSYGGYAAAAALTFSPETFAAGISMFGPYNLLQYAHLEMGNTPLWRKRVGDPYTEAGKLLLKSYSPQYHASLLQSPILLTTGSMDARIPQQQVDRYAHTLYQAGKDVTYFYYPQEGHDYADPASWTSFWSLAERFLQRHLGGEAEPITSDFRKGHLVWVYGKHLYDIR